MKHPDKDRKIKRGKGDSDTPVITVNADEVDGSRNMLTNTLGTVDRAIREKNIFTALSKMPIEFQTTLFENGWIEKKRADDNRNASEMVLSMHKNVERVRAVAKRYDPGLLWTDAYAGGVNWLVLHPDVVVNRFPRDAYAAIKLCGQTLVGKTEFDDRFPRAYQATAETVTGPFFEDYALTACVSILRAFVNGNAKCNENGQVPILTLYFAINKCKQYVTENTTNCYYTDSENEWTRFFENYYLIVDKYQNFTTLPDSKVENVTLESTQILKALNALRPQTIMDGCKNIWIIKCKQSSKHKPFMSNKLEDILKKCIKINSEDYIIQKYIETPLLHKSVKFNVQTWIVISTLDDCLTVWIYETCCMQFYPHKFSLDVNKSKNVHFNDFESNKPAINSPVLSCDLKRLREKLNAMGIEKDHDSAVYLKIKNSIVSSVLATRNDLNLRPNCFELFQVTFVLGSDLNPWLIDIKSDPCLTYPFYHTMSSITNGVVKNLAKILTARDRVSMTKIGMFDLLYQGSIPGEYVAHEFVEKTVTKKCHNTEIKNLQKIYNSQRVHHWKNDLVKTYIENVQVNEIDNYYLTQNFDFNSNLSLRDNVVIMEDKISEDNLCLEDLKESMRCLISGSKIDVYEAKYCLHLLEKTKMRVTSAQNFYKAFKV